MYVRRIVWQYKGNMDLGTDSYCYSMQGCFWLCNHCGHSHEGCVDVTSLVLVACCPPDTFRQNGRRGRSFRQAITPAGYKEDNCYKSKRPNGVDGDTTTLPHPEDGRIGRFVERSGGTESTRRIRRLDRQCDASQPPHTPLTCKEETNWTGAKQSRQ